MWHNRGFSSPKRLFMQHHILNKEITHWREYYATRGSVYTRIMEVAPQSHYICHLNPVSHMIHSIKINNQLHFKKTTSRSCIFKQPAADKFYSTQTVLQRRTSLSDRFQNGGASRQLSHFDWLKSVASVADDTYQSGVGFAIEGVAKSPSKYTKPAWNRYR